MGPQRLFSGVGFWSPGSGVPDHLAGARETADATCLLVHLSFESSVFWLLVGSLWCMFSLVLAPGKAAIVVGPT